MTFPAAAAVVATLAAAAAVAQAAGAESQPVGEEEALLTSPVLQAAVLLRDIRPETDKLLYHGQAAVVVLRQELR